MEKTAKNFIISLLIIQVFLPTHGFDFESHRDTADSRYDRYKKLEDVDDYYDGGRRWVRTTQRPTSRPTSRPTTRTTTTKQKEWYSGSISLNVLFSSATWSTPEEQAGGGTGKIKEICENIEGGTLCWYEREPGRARRGTNSGRRCMNNDWSMCCATCIGSATFRKKSPPYIVALPDGRKQFFPFGRCGGKGDCKGRCTRQKTTQTILVSNTRRPIRTKEELALAAYKQQLRFELLSIPGYCKCVNR